MRHVACSTPSGAVWNTPLSAFAHESSGRVAALNLQARTLTLHDGSVFHLPSHISDPRFSTGMQVDVTWDLQGDRPIANTITPSGPYRVIG